MTRTPSGARQRIIDMCKYNPTPAQLRKAKRGYERPDKKGFAATKKKAGDTIICDNGKVIHV